VSIPLFGALDTTSLSCCDKASTGVSEPAGEISKLVPNLNFLGKIQVFRTTPLQSQGLDVAFPSKARQAFAAGEMNDSSSRNVSDWVNEYQPAVVLF